MPADRHRFEAIFDDHARSLLTYALRRVERPEDAADIVSETMLIAWRRLGDVPDGPEAGLWLYGVARNVLANARRAHRRGARLGAKLREHLAESFHDDHADRVGTAVLVRTALGRLHPDDAEILRLTAWEGLSPADIATAMSIPPGTIRSRLHRARERFRGELGTLGVERSDGAGHEDHDEHVLVRKAEAGS